MIADITPDKIATWQAIALAGIGAAGTLWAAVYLLIGKIKSDVATLQTKTEATAQLTLDVAQNQTANKASESPDPAKVAAVIQTMDSPVAVTPPPMSVRT